MTMTDLDLLPVAFLDLIREARLLQVQYKQNSIGIIVPDFIIKNIIERHSRDKFLIAKFENVVGEILERFSSDGDIVPLGGFHDTPYFTAKSMSGIIVPEYSRKNSTFHPVIIYSFREDPTTLRHYRFILLTDKRQTTIGVPIVLKSPKQ